MEQEIFESAVRSRGDLAGVFEYDGDTSYFYLYDVSRSGGHKIVDSIHIMSGQPDFSGSDIAVRWDGREERVGLFVRNTLWGVFNVVQKTKYGGNYSLSTQPAIPPGEAVLRT